MSYAIAKDISRKLGLYRQARWFNRHFLNRRELHRERKDASFYASFIAPGDLVFDVGANYGEKTKAFLNLGARVVAFEPQPDCKNELHARCGSNTNLIIVEAGLGPRTEKRMFYVRQHRGASGFLEDWRGGIEANLEVSLVTLDSMIERYDRPTYIKIDVEGFEYEVLNGLNRPVPYVSFEYHLAKKCGVKRAIDCIEYLSKFGDILINITPAEDLTFAYRDWITKDDFLDEFPIKISSRPGFAYGDIFVKTKCL